MEADFCTAKQLGMNPRMCGLQLFAWQPLPPWQNLRAFVPHLQPGSHSADSLGLPVEEQAQQDALPSDTGRHWKYACHPGLNHVARTIRYLHVQISKIANIARFRNTKILGRSSGLDDQNIFMPQPTPAHQQFVLCGTSDALGESPDARGEGRRIVNIGVLVRQNSIRWLSLYIFPYIMVNLNNNSV